ncbi:MAG: tetratricopeptide repeat protein, partial [Thiohalorhabdaceae bacterium]
VDGEVVDGFTGALPEPQIREFIDRLLPSEADQAIARARQALDADQLGQAEQELATVLDENSQNGRALMLLARLRLRQNRPDDAAEPIRSLPARYEGDPEVAGLRSRIEFARIAEEAESEEAVRQDLADD